MTASIDGQATKSNIGMPSATDTYFPPVDNEYEAKHIPNAELRPIPTVWGHMSPFNSQDQPFIDKALADALVSAR